MSTRLESERIIRALAGMAQPSVGDTIVFTGKGWRFQGSSWLGMLEADPDISRAGDAWFNTTDSKMRVNTGDGILESGEFTAMP